MKCSDCGRKLSEAQIKIAKALGAKRVLCRKCTRESKAWKAYQKVLRKHKMTFSMLSRK